MDISKALGERGIAHVETILETQGRTRYFEDWETEITDYVKSARILPGHAPVIERYSAEAQERLPYRLAVTHYPAGVSRKFQYEKLKAADSALYYAEVTVQAPDARRRFSFPKAGELQLTRSAGWRAEQQRSESLRNVSRRGGLSRAAEDLSRIRDTLRDLKAVDTAARRALSDLVTELGAESSAYLFRGETVRSVENKLRQSIDLGRVEKDARLRPFLTRTPRQPYTKVWFQRVTDGEL